MKPAGEILTKEKFIHIFEDIKDLIHSSAKGTETVLKKEIGEVREELHTTQTAVLEIARTTRRIDSELQGLKTEVKDFKSEMYEFKSEVKTEFQQVRAELKSIRDDLKSTEERLSADIRSTEERLSVKIDGQGVCLKNHETRISSLEAQHS